MGASNTLSWAIKHYRPKQSIEDESARQIIDALFISHFHGDHIGGLAELTKCKHVRRIYIPHYTPQQALALLGTCSQWLLSAQTDAIEKFLVELDNLANGRNIFGKRTIYVLGAGNDFVPPKVDMPDDGPLAASDPDWVTIPKSIDQSRIWRDSEPITIESWGKEVAWEIRSWCYRESLGLSAKLANQLASIPGWPQNLLSGNISSSDMQWIINHRKQIHFVYLSVLKSFSGNSAIPSANPNVISMAIYSGPAQRGKLRGCVRRTNYGKSSATRIVAQRHGRTFQSVLLMDEEDEALGWIGTGDVPLGNENIWSDFSAHYGWRLDEIATILMPHHGSGGGYYNSQLIGRHSPLCVFSAAALSKHHHPSQFIIADVLRLNADYIVVNENTRPSFDEHFSVYV